MPFKTNPDAPTSTLPVSLPREDKVRLSMLCQLLGVKQPEFAREAIITAIDAKIEELLSNPVSKMEQLASRLLRASAGVPDLDADKASEAKIANLEAKI